MEHIQGTVHPTAETLAHLSTAVPLTAADGTSLDVHLSTNGQEGCGACAQQNLTQL